MKCSQEYIIDYTKVAIKIFTPNQLTFFSFYSQYTYIIGTGSETYNTIKKHINRNYKQKKNKNKMKLPVICPRTLTT